MQLSTYRSRLEALTGFRRYTSAFVLGAVMTLTMPPVGAFPLLLACVPGFISLSRGSKSKAGAFLTGWTFGAGYFIFGLYWISAALFVDIRQWGWVMPFSALLGPALFALYYGLIPLLAWRYRNDVVSYTLIIVALWSLVEWLRGHLFTGFPWNLVGYAWTHVLPVMQTSAFAGIYGLTLLTLLWAAIPVLWRNKKLASVAVISLIAVTCLGALRLSLHPTEPSGDIKVRIVQPNIPETEKWNQDNDLRNLRQQAALSNAKSPATFVIWPETAVTTDLKAYPSVARYIAGKLPPGSLGILGALRVTQEEDEKPKFFNSVAVLDGEAHIVAGYDKHHLVPFGEYIPFRDKLNLTPIALAISNLGDFTRGDGPETLSVGNLPSFSPLICYEVIFPHEVVPKNDRPAWIVNVTNDAWYGKTAGPHQHFDTARVRAIEEGLPLARAADTGISGMIDPLGRVITKQPLGTEGTVDSILPKALPPTLYEKTGDMLFLGMFTLLTLLAETLRLKDNRNYPTSR